MYEGAGGQDRSLCSLLQRGLDGMRREQHDESAGNQAIVNNLLTSIDVAANCPDDSRALNNNAGCNSAHDSYSLYRHRHQRLWELHEP